jgi:cytochrome c2
MEVSVASRAFSLRLAGATTLVVALALVGVGGNYLRDQQKKSHHAIQMTGGEPQKAKSAIRQYGCAACHDIPGIRWPGGLAGPSLSGMADRLYVGGVVKNTPGNLVRWIVDPKQFNARTAMPVTGISESEARNVAAYLYKE